MFRFEERNLLDEVAIFIPNGETLAGKIRVRIVLHMCNLQTPYFSTFCRAAELKGSPELKLVPSNLEICLEHTIGVFQDMNN